MLTFSPLKRGGLVVAGFLSRRIMRFVLKLIGMIEARGDVFADKIEVRTLPDDDSYLKQ